MLYRRSDINDTHSGIRHDRVYLSQDSRGTSEAHKKIYEVKVVMK